jgi:hypothetical protein
MNRRLKIDCPLILLEAVLHNGMLFVSVTTLCALCYERVNEIQAKLTTSGDIK